MTQKRMTTTAAIIAARSIHPAGKATRAAMMTMMMTTSAETI
jgi:hypothetical protein